MPAENPIRFLKLDYESQKDALLTRIRTRWPLLWNDFLTSNFGIVIVDLIAYCMAIFAFVVHRRAAENFVPTMTLRESAVRLAALTGKKLRGPAAAVVPCEATLSSVVGFDVTIRSGTLVRATDRQNLVFEVSQDYTISAGKLTPETLVASFSAALTGADPTQVQTNIYATKGASYLDLVDSAINLKTLIEVGQKFQQTGTGSTEPTYDITNVSAATDALSNNRIVLDRPWEGPSMVITGQVLEPRIAVVQGQTVEVSATTPAANNANYTLRLERVPVIANFAEVTVDDVAWTQVDHIGVSGPEDEVFELRVLPNGQAFLVFGDNRFGKALPEEASIVASYRVGGGSSGNVVSGAVSTSVNGVYLTTGQPVPVRISNRLSAGAGGQDEESLEEARASIPLHAGTGDRGVTLDDYRSLAGEFVHPRFGSIAVARATTRGSANLLEGNIVEIIAWVRSTGGALASPSSALKNALRSYIQERAVGTDYVVIADGTARPAPISVRFKTTADADITSVKTAVIAKMSELVSVLAANSTDLPLSDLSRALDEVSGVQFVDIATPSITLAPLTEREVYTPPSESYLYDITLSSSGGNNLDGALTVYPVHPWSFKAYFDSIELLVLPDTEPGYARLLGEGLATYLEGRSDAIPTANAGREGFFFYALDTITLYQCRVAGASYAWVSVPLDTARKSRVDLRTGRVEITTTGVSGNLTVKHIVATGYRTERRVDMFVSYVPRPGQDSALLRRNIRDAINSTVYGLASGSSLFAQRDDGLSASTFNLADVVALVPGVERVQRVALETAGSLTTRIDANSFERVLPGAIVLNGARD